jgi:pilus assembly protein CpaB
MRSRAAVLLSVGLGLLAAIMMFAYVSSRERELYQQVAMKTTVIASKDILANTVLDESMLQRIQVPQKYLQPRAAVTFEEAVGRVSVVPIAAGAQILGTFLGDPGRAALAFEVPRGMRAVAITITDDTGVGGLVRPGNFVDIIGTFEFGRPTGMQNGTITYADERTETRTMMQNVQVVGVNREIRDAQQEERPAPAAAGQETARRPPETRPAQLRTVTVLVEPVRVQELILAQEIGTLTLSLRTSLDQGAVELPMLDPLGLLKVPIPVKPKRNVPSFRDIGRGLF